MRWARSRENAMADDLSAEFLLAASTFGANRLTQAAQGAYATPAELIGSLFQATPPEFEAERAEYERVAVVEVISAFELSQTQQDSLARALKKRLDREITMTTSVDRTLLGGVIIRSGDTVIDGSARGRLARLKRDLNA